MHDSLTVRWAKIPKTKRFVHWSGNKRIVDRWDVEWCYFLRMSWKVAQILVVVQAQVADGVVNFRRAVDCCGTVAVSKVDQIDSILFWVNCSCLSSLLAVIQNNLIVIRTTVNRKMKIYYGKLQLGSNRLKMRIKMRRSGWRSYLMSFSPFDEKSIEFILSWFSRKTLATLKLRTTESVRRMVAVIYDCTLKLNGMWQVCGVNQSINVVLCCN